MSFLTGKPWHVEDAEGGNPDRGRDACHTEKSAALPFGRAALPRSETQPLGQLVQITRVAEVLVWR